MAPWCDGTHKVARPRPAVELATDVPDDETRTMDFHGLSISYDRRILEPRPWTAGQSRWAADLLHTLPAGPVLEVCAGAGHIGLLAVRDQDRDLVMVDASAAACEHARHNASAAGMGERVTVRCGRMQEVLDPDERFPLVIADPPWVPSGTVDTFPDDPRHAIDGGPTGLDLVAVCLDVMHAHLAPDGAGILQVGPDGQADAVRAHLDAHPDLGLEVTERRFHARGALLLLVPRT
jgi:release factor glutamine methyltransferase